ncbi:MAG: 16S rRNA (cytosine(1402)-N(4))-methyltransferase RsmH, partial [Gammaproteobacteria bacterium]|nr:16S rRNA (cytosine(1402)-N(4))-methyltransferase RsmH [Gammaproteobacteria bacterium]
EALEALHIDSDGIYVDGTFGRGGHTQAILRQLGPQGRVLSIDKDPDAVRTAQQRFGTDARFAIERGSFARLQELVVQRAWPGRVRGVLLDLGVSSPQLEDARRGFSFQNDGPLDMRMDPDSGMSVAQWLARAQEREIADVIKGYGEERFARRIARAIVEQRVIEPILTTLQLSEIISASVPRREPGKHPATRSFQALRIFINRELDDLSAALAQALEVLAAGGRLVVISFHSLEDRIVKQFFRTQAVGDNFPRGLPVTADQMRPRLRLIGKASYPTEAEVSANPRARSAVMRVAEKLA